MKRSIVFIIAQFFVISLCHVPICRVIRIFPSTVVWLLHRHAARKQPSSLDILRIFLSALISPGHTRPTQRHHNKKKDQKRREKKSLYFTQKKKMYKKRTPHDDVVLFCILNPSVR